LHILSVSSLNEQIKSLLEQSFSRVMVEGELSRVTHHGSGHIYFSIKDEDSTIKAVMFKGNATKLKFQLEEGLKVIIDAAISVYKPRGDYQLNCFSIEPSGFGALALAYEQLKKDLELKGYFAPERKKQLPRFPKKLAFITSATGAALQDMLRVASARYKAVEIELYDVLVQGEMASFAIADAIKEANKKEYDVMVLARGGGSIEDLWAFNELRVAEAIYLSTIPIVSAIGHEIDWVISDFVADVRAATPSAAMQIVLPDESELMIYLDSLASQIEQQLKAKLYTLSQALEHTKNLYSKYSVEQKITLYKESFNSLAQNFDRLMALKIQGYKNELETVVSAFPQAIDTKLSVAKNQVELLAKMLQSQNPKTRNLGGFAQISKDSKVIDISKLDVEDRFFLMSSDFKIEAKVLQKERL